MQFYDEEISSPNKDKLLIQLLTYVLEQGHFSPQDINDEFSEQVLTI
jgi:carboxyl-terminal processing protease